MSQSGASPTMRFPIEQIWVDEDARDAPLTSEILEKLPSAQVFFGRAYEKHFRNGSRPVMIVLMVSTE